MALVASVLVVAPRPAFSVELESRVDHDVPALAKVSGKLRGVRRGIAPFRLIGVTYRSASDAHPLVKVADGSNAGRWFPLEHEEESGEDGGAVPAEGVHTTMPLFIDRATGYEVRLPADARGVRVHLVRDETKRVRLSLEHARAAGAPHVLSRSAWGARRPAAPPVVAPELKLAVVHHTATAGQSYSSSQVPSLLRGIQAYHMDAHGWNDIAYNFVIDRFGRIWEGRAGGIAKAVVGGHARGFNTRSTGVVILGNFQTDSLSSYAKRGLQQLLAWKLFVHGIDPRSTVRFRSMGSPRYAEGTVVSLPPIVGHGDVGLTSCPGTAVRRVLGDVRSRVAASWDAQRGHGTFSASRSSRGIGALPYIGDFNADGRSDILWYGAGSIPDAIWFAKSAGGFRVVSTTVEATYTPLVGDYDHDGRDDIFWYRPGSAGDRIWYGRPDSTFDRRDSSVVGTYQPIIGDFDRDLRDDILWYAPGTAADRLWLGSSNRAFHAVNIDVRGWYEPLVGDFNDDDHDDILWYGPGTAPDRLWLGQDDGAFVTRVLDIGLDAQPLVGDYAGTQGADIVWYGGPLGPHQLWISDRSAAFSKSSLSANGIFEPFVADVDGGGRDDIVWLGRGALPDRLWRSDGRGGWYGTAPTISIDAPGYAADINRDGRDDLVFARPNAATVHLWRAT